MQWPDGDWPGTEAADHRVDVGGIVDLELIVPDKAALSEWSLHADLPLSLRDGPPDLVAVSIEVDGRACRIGPEKRAVGD